MRILFLSLFNKNINSFQLTTVNLANFNKSCLRPELTNSTVAFAFSPEPSNFTTVPTPKRWCSILTPSCNPPKEEFVPETGVSFPIILRAAFTALTDLKFPSLSDEDFGSDT